MKEKFSHAKLKWEVKTGCIYIVVISGKYNDDVMNDFMDVLKEDFEYIFEGFKLECEW